MPEFSAFSAEVAARLGVLPNFFRTASAAPGLIEELWAFAKSAYLDSPLPSLFKERLFVHLSRFCEVRYCVVRHVGFLMGEGRPAGDVTATPHTLEQIMALLDRPVPDAAALDDAFARLSLDGALAEAPLPETQAEADLFDALTVIFLAPRRSERARQAIRTSMGDRWFELLTAFLAFVRTAHYWTETHPELEYEPDMRERMTRHPELAALLLNRSEATEASATVQLHEALGELHRAQDALSENEALKDRIVASSQDCLKVLDSEARLIWLSHSAREALGCDDLGDLEGRYWPGLWPPEFQDDVKAAVQAALSGKERRFSGWRPTLNGERKFWDVIVAPIAEADGAVGRVLAVSRDMTEQRRAEEALRQSERRLSQAIDVGGIGHWELMLATGEMTTSVHCRRNFGRPEDAAFTYDDLVASIHPDDRERQQKVVNEAVETRSGFEIEYRAISPNGSVKWVHICGRYEDGDTPRLAGVSMDITDSKRAEAMLKDSRDRQSFLLKLSDDIRAQPGEDAIGALVTHRLAEALALDRCYLARLYPEEDRVVVGPEYRRGDLDPASGEYRLSDFPEVVRQVQTRTVVIPDVAGDPALTESDKAALAAIDIGAFVTAGVRRGDERVLWALIVVSAVPRTWTPIELALVENVAERTWAAFERARVEAALRDSEARLGLILQSVGDAVFVGTASGITVANAAALEQLGFDSREELNRDIQMIAQEVGPRYYATGVPIPADEQVFARALRGEEAVQEVLITNRRTGAERVLRSAASPVIEDGRAVAAVAINTDITELKRAEATLRESEERQAFFLALGDGMRAAGDAEAIIATATQLLGERLKASRIVFSEIDEDAGLAHIRTGWTADGGRPHPAELRLTDFGGAMLDDLRAGRIVRCDDVGKPPFERDNLAALYAIDIRAVLSVPLIVGGRFVVNLNVHQHDPRRWTDGEVTLVEEVAERLWAALARARAEAAVRTSEEKFRALFETMGQGYSECRMLRDADGRAVDHRFLAINPAFERLCGFSAADALGRTLTEVAGPSDAIVADYDRILRGGVPERVEQYMPQLGRWYEANVYPGKDDRFVVLWEEITDRKRAETALRESEERQAFLLELSDTLRPLRDSVEIQSAAVRLLGERLRVGRAGYYEVEADQNVFFLTARWEREIISLPDRMLITDFGEEIREGYRAGRTMIARDTEQDAATDDNLTAVRSIRVRAWIGVPLVKDGRWFAAVGVHSAVPRDWTAAEIRLVEEVGERTWAAIERTRAEAALRESEERLRQFGEASQDILWIRDATSLQWTYLTPAFEEIYGLSRAEALSGDNYRSWQDLILPEDRDDAVAAIARVRTGEHVTFEFRVLRPIDGTIRWLRNTDFPITDHAGKVILIGGVGHDVTRMKAIEAEMAASEDRLRTLMEGIPQLVWRSCDQGLWTWASPQWQDFTGQSEEQSRRMGWIDVVHPNDHAATKQAWEDAKADGLLDVEYRIRRAADGAWIWHHTRSVPVHDGEGRIVEWLGTSTDVHELRDLQERQKVLVAELQHRTRNLMGVVRSMADKTARASVDLPDFRNRFRDRLDALARVQGLLSRMHDHDRVTFDELVATELAAMDGSADRVTVDGPSGVRLRSSTVQTLALALHELATNAMKYGALGQPSARLAITWRVERPADDDKPWLHIEWQESGVQMPPVDAAPRGTGQGRELIERALPYQLHAETSYVLGPDGVRCTISMPVSATMAEVE